MAQTKTSWPLLIAWLVLLVGAPALKAQFGSLVSPGQAAQAYSQDELDSYLEIVKSVQSQDVVRKVEAFALQYPRSELLGLAYQNQVRAFEQLNDFERMLAAGRKALQANPANLNTLLILAPAMASRADHRSDRAQLLAEAEAYARQALESIDKTRLPHSVTLKDWTLEKRQMLSQVHEVLGLVALQRGQTQAAVTEFETAIGLSPAPEGIQFLRLGLALAATGQKAGALQNLHRAAELGPDSIRAFAAAQLEKMKDAKSLN
jgi:tetratricopeptide (TPR) repeat protein